VHHQGKTQEDPKGATGQNPDPGKDPPGRDSSAAGKTTAPQRRESSAAPTRLRLPRRAETGEGRGDAGRPAHVLDRAGKARQGDRRGLAKLVAGRGPRRLRRAGGTVRTVPQGGGRPRGPGG